MKSYNFEVEVTKNVKNGSITIKREARLELSDDTIISEIIIFEKDLKKAVSEIKKSVKNNDFIKAYLSVSRYVKGSNGRLSSKGFDRWQYSGYSEDEEGIYLAPDTDYTEGNRDLYIEFNGKEMEAIQGI